jgi:hypothetical protein
MDRAKDASNGLDLKLSNCLGRMTGGDGTGSIAIKIVQSRDLDIDDEALREKEIVQRAHWIWKALTE